MFLFKENQLLEKLERQRRDAITATQKGTIFIVISILICAATTLLLAKHIFVIFGGIMIALIISMGIHRTMIKKPRNLYRTSFKHHILNNIVKQFDQRLTHQPNKGVTEHTFLKSGLYKNRIDRYHTEDLCHGTLDKTRLQFAEIHAQYKTTSTNSKGHTQTTWHTLFQGLFFIADFHKNFRSDVTVLPDVAERSFGFLGRKLQKLGGNLVRLENPDFEKAFVVRGADQIETRYILTPDMQERLLNIRRILGNDIRIAFRHSSLFLSIPTRHNHFEPNFSVPASDQGQLNRLYNELGTLLHLVEELNLNTRIWTKE